jgi:hypothetical protein
VDEPIERHAPPVALRLTMKAISKLVWNPHRRSRVQGIPRRPGPSYQWARYVHLKSALGVDVSY